MTLENKLDKIDKTLRIKREKTTGIGFSQLLAIAFIVLKLTGVITWSWLWVLSPLWIPFAVALLIVFVWLIFLYIAEVQK
jgi:Flp pilus assembly protein TadB